MRCRALVVAVLAALTALSATAAPASAEIIELGAAAEPLTPSCPGSPCLAVTLTTGYQAKAGEQRGLFVVPQDGKIVAWTITLGRPGPRQIRFFDDLAGGGASAGISVLRPGRRLYARVTGQSPVRPLQAWFGQTVQFPLGNALNVRKGYLVALTVPTWAPALAVGFGNDVSWRASRPRGSCEDTRSQSAQTVRKSISRYRCLYRQARLSYSVTLVTTPVAPEPAQ